VLRIAPVLLLLLSLLVLTACQSLGGVPTLVPTVALPTPTQGPMAAPPTFTPTAPPQPTPTPAPSPTPRPANCPAPGTPLPPDRPAAFADYPTAIADFLSAGGLVAALDATLRRWGAVNEQTGRVTARNLTGNGDLEVIVPLSDPTSTARPRPGDLLIYRCLLGTMVPLYAASQNGGFDGYAIRLLKVDELTGLPPAEVAFVASRCTARGCTDRLEMIGWDGTAFVSRMGEVLELPNATFTVERRRIVAEVGEWTSADAGPQRPYTEIWEWNGRAFLPSQRIIEPPIYRIHAFHDGDAALRAGEYITATQLYQQVIEDEALQTWGTPEEPEILAALARFRLVQVRLLQGDRIGAEQLYYQLEATYPLNPVGKAIGRVAQTFWTAYSTSNNLTAACAAAASAVNANPAFLDFLNSYGRANPTYTPDDVCPFSP